MSNQKKTPFILIISGPTASGKTDLAEKIATIFPAQIINADVGQFYKPLSVGTAKPDWQKSPIKQHLFDVLDEPKDLTVFKYDELVYEKIDQILKLGQLPIIVGGSLFYIKSLYFPPRKIEKKLQEHFADFSQIPDEKLWDELNKIDPQRAAKLHKNDIYRIKRALEIWQTSGIKPSEQEPEYAPKFNSFFVFVNLPKEKLHERIDKRTEIMIKQGWIEEAKNFLGISWESFLRCKGLIGYPEIFDWLKKGSHNIELKKLIEDIQVHTKQYAKRQITFWKSLKKQLMNSNAKSNLTCKILEVDGTDQKNIDLIHKSLSETLKN